MQNHYLLKKNLISYALIERCEGNNTFAIVYQLPDIWIDQVFFLVPGT